MSGSCPHHNPHRSERTHRHDQNRWPEPHRCPPGIRARPHIRPVRPVPGPPGPPARPRRPARQAPNVRPESANPRRRPLPAEGVPGLTRTRSEIGRANRARGIATERDVARYLRVTGWPDAERKPDTGWSTVDRTSPDAGDIRNTPGLCWQVKSTPELTGEKLTQAMRQAADQAVVAGADYGSWSIAAPARPAPACGGRSCR
jgi:hypothetical protein